MTEKQFIHNMNKIKFARLPKPHKEVYLTIANIINEKHELENEFCQQEALINNLWHSNDESESIIELAITFIEEYNQQQDRKIFKHKIPDELLAILLGGGIDD